MKPIPAVFTALALGGTAPALAGEISSLYSSLDLDSCELVKSNPDEGGHAVWHCPGHDGMQVTVAEGDLRFFVSYGPDADGQTVREQTLAPFNSINKTLEWRVERINGRWVPFATILRYFWDSSDGSKGQTLVVTKIGPDDACHVAHVRADGNPEANRQAREIADRRARAFDCSKTELIRYDPR